MNLSDHHVVIEYKNKPRKQLLLFGASPITQQLAEAQNPWRTPNIHTMVYLEARFRISLRFCGCDAAMRAKGSVGCSYGDEPCIKRALAVILTKQKRQVKASTRTG